MPNSLLQNKFCTCVVVFMCLGILTCGCTTIYNPATGRNEMIMIDTAQEVAMGKDMQPEIQKKYQLLNDPQRQTRLNSIGKRIAAASDRQDLSYSFSVVKDTDLNAFAIPGGFIYVNSGLMDAATDDELACVLAHEIGHVAARHSVKKLQSVMGYQLVLTLALGASGQQTLQSAMNIIYSLVSLGYSRKDELLADRLSVRYAKRAGFNPYGMVSFFKKLEKNAASKGSHYNPVFFSSHPATEERIKNVEDEIKGGSF